MNKNPLHPWFLIILLLLIPAVCHAQKIENVSSNVSGSNIHIQYDLLDLADDQPVFIRVYVSTDGGLSFGGPLKSVTGDVGMVVDAGKGKQIIWDVFSEVDELVSESVKFRVKADLLASSQQKPSLQPGFQLGLSAQTGNKVELSSWGFSLKALIRIKQLGLGIRGEYYRSYEAPIAEAGFDNYMGFSGGAFAEYDVIKHPKYSLYPFVCLGQTKISEQSASSNHNYAGYSIFYSAGMGADLAITKFLRIGAEVEYIMAPVIDIDDQDGSTVEDRIVIDGLWAGISLKFSIHAGN